MDGNFIYWLTRLACFHELFELVFALSLIYLLSAIVLRILLRNSSSELRDDMKPLLVLLNRLRLASAICGCSLMIVCFVPNRTDVKLMVVDRLVNHDGVLIHLENDK